MSIGIYGDSYAEPQAEAYQWPQHIGECTNYALGGSDVFYSYTHFLKTNHLHEKILFIVSSPARWSDCYKGDWIHSSPGIWKADDVDSTVREFLRDKIKGLHEFSAFVGSRKMTTLCSLMLKDMINTRPDIKFIHAFDLKGNVNLQEQCIDDKIQDKLVTPLFNITEFENNKVNVSMEYHNRPNHLTTESHKILSGLIRNFLNSSDRWFDCNLELFKNINIDMSEMNR